MFVSREGGACARMATAPVVVVTTESVVDEVTVVVVVVVVTVGIKGAVEAATTVIPAHG